ncbi:RNA ligase family protein [Halorussus sp. MSC15.2]|uniref:RNA ligase family protein n=1 Tax=Halorussus sp. MSC15.2 TaxID=2283638 RepID=UPI0013D54B8B|nr:RNA ligase family protein [Halorussus sp. MSC15.2]NEU58799.1 hypothetical protein [Halorussus sp. MSC15.2]
MKQFPAVPRADDAPSDLLDSGHLWIQERVDGAHLRFRLRESGLIEFGDRRRTYDAHEIPLGYRRAVRHVRESFDREALRATRDDPSSVVFFGEATVRRAIDYDWDRTPPFLGFDVWDAAERDSAGNRSGSDDADGRFLPPDAVERAYDRLGLDAVNAFEKEVRAADFDPDSYEVPDSAWYDGPAAGVVVRNKTGQRAVIPHPDVRGSDDGPSADDPSPTEASADELAAAYATDQRIQSVVGELEASERPVTFDAVFDRLVEDIAREEYADLFDGDRSVDASAFRSAVAARTQARLDAE